jgi:hypothetical protein
VGVPHPVRVPSVLPFVAVLVGLGVSVLRFRVGDALGGLVASLVGVVLMMGIAMRLPASD